MNLREVFALIIGVFGFLILRVIYLGNEIPSPNGYYDMRPAVFGIGVVLVFLFGLIIGWENK